MKNSNDTIENRTRDFPACSAVPQTPPRVTVDKTVGNTFHSDSWQQQNCFFCFNKLTLRQITCNCLCYWTVKDQEKIIYTLSDIKHQKK
jgi:hypothetical protein